MSKMREAFEKWAEETRPCSYLNARDGWEAGYQAAIADVKAGGAYCAIEWTTGNKIETYKLPEDEK